GSFRVDYCFSLRKGDDVQALHSDDWPDELARVVAMSACHAVVRYQGQPVDVYCDPEGDALRRKYNAALFAGGDAKNAPSDDRSWL
ncbi:zona occludens toxin, partial [Aeromonas sp. 1HA1]|nr:zona occludens toxin [Aeromonas sp. 1HA1]